jgi:hypothetical protein
MLTPLEPRANPASTHTEVQNKECFAYEEREMRKFGIGVMFAASLLMVFSSTAYAGGTRVKSMGANGNGLDLGDKGGFLSGYITIEDEVNALFLPSTLVDFGSLAMIDSMSWVDGVVTVRVSLCHWRRHGDCFLWWTRRVRGGGIHFFHRGRKRERSRCCRHCGPQCKQGFIAL